MKDAIKVYLLAALAVAVTVGVTLLLILAYGWFVEREMAIGSMRVQEYIGQEGKFTVVYSCERGVQRVDFAPGIYK